MRRDPLKGILVSLASGLVLCAGLGCVHVPPQNVARDRLDYGQALADSWKEQTLSNIVRLRYGDAPTFLEVTSIINTYSAQASVNAGGSVPKAGGMYTDTLTAGGSGSWSNTPTVTYQPLVGQKFTQSLLSPLPPSAVFRMIEAGWPVPLILPTALRSINGLVNQSGGHAGDRGFEELVAALGRLQRSRAVSIRIEEREADRPILIVIGGAPGNPSLQEDMKTVRGLLGLTGEARELRITFGALPQGRDEIAVMTRSMLEIMLELSFGIDVPPEHLAQGRVLAGGLQPGETPAAPLLHIRVGEARPADAFVAVPYRDLWYWIEDTDTASKTKFTFLMILFSLAESGQANQSPVVTVNAGR